MASTSPPTRSVRCTSLALPSRLLSGSRLSPDPRPIDCELSFARRKKSGRISNPIKRLFSPYAGQTVTVKYDAPGAPSGVSLNGAARSFGIHKPTITIDYDAKASAIVILVNEDRQDVAIPLEFIFTIPTRALRLSTRSPRAATSI